MRETEEDPGQKQTNDLRLTYISELVFAFGSTANIADGTNVFLPESNFIIVDDYGVVVNMKLN